MDPQSPGWHTWVREVSEHNTTSPRIVCACSHVCILQQRLCSELGYFKIVCHCSAAAQHLIPCYLSDGQGAKVLHTFIRTDTDIVVGVHEIDGGDTVRLRQTAQNIVLPHSGGIAVSRTSTVYEPENSRKSQDSQNKCISNWVVALLRKCHLVVETRKEIHKRPPVLVLPAAPLSQSHDGTEVTNQPMLDAVIAYPSSSSPDTFSRPVSLRSYMSL